MSSGEVVKPVDYVDFVQCLGLCDACRCKFWFVYLFNFFSGGKLRPRYSLVILV